MYRREALSALGGTVSSPDCVEIMEHKAPVAVEVAEEEEE
jgi:hypothetical protein